MAFGFGTMTAMSAAVYLTAVLAAREKLNYGSRAWR